MLAGTGEITVNDATEVVLALRELIGKAASSIKQYRYRVEEEYIINRVPYPAQSGDVDGFKAILAVDSAFTPQPLYFSGLSLAIVSGALIVERQKNINKFSENKIFYRFYSEIDSDYVAFKARILERDLILRHINKVDRPCIVLIDGEIYVETPQFSSRTISKLDVNRVNEAIDRIAEEGCNVVGIVKRDYSHIVTKRLGINANDKSFLSYILSRGEYIVLERRIARRKCFTVYYKPLRGFADQAVRADICNTRSGYNVTGIVRFLIDSANYTGLPFYIDIVDRLAKNNVKRIAKAVSSIVPREAVRGEREYVGMFTNPQDVFRKKKS